METQFRCQSEGRRKAVAAKKTLNGVDYLEVATVDQKTLKVFFIHPLPGELGGVPAAPALTKDNIVIEGGVRIKNIRVVAAGVNKKVLTVTVSERGDFSTYKLRLVTSATVKDPPAGFDPQLAAIDFSFKVACPSEFDCESVVECPPQKLPQPEISYLAKDYASFRRLILDRMSVLMPEWRERNPADAEIALVELLALVGDHLSYYQDAVATEAYLGTARKRVSLRRHARLLDYTVHDGCNARAWVCLMVTRNSAADGKVLPARTPLLTRGSEEKVVIAPTEMVKALAEQPTVFETMHDLKLDSAHNRIAFYTWSDSECCLPRGSTRATLLDNPPLSLQEGELLLFEEVISPTTGTEADADLTHRHAVRLKKVLHSEDKLDGTKVVEIEWHETDALPFPLCISARIESATGAPEVREVSVARGNVVLADHGRTLERQDLLPSMVPKRGKYRPELRHREITFAVPYDHEAARLEAAASALRQEARSALPSSLSLSDGEDSWVAQRDLLASDRFQPDFVVEVERDGSAHLRFGDATLGKRPSPGASFNANYRIGNGRSGNVGAETIARIVWDTSGIEQVRNPLPATGGTDMETMEEVRQFAPQAFRRQERAVTPEDYAEVAQRHAEVQRAAATFRWTGSWTTVFVTIDRKGGLDVDDPFKSEMRTFLEKYRLAGYDLEINAPVFVPLDIVLLVCVKAGYFQSDVKEALLEVFSRHELADGRRGFFHPDEFTFGQPVYLSRIYQMAMAVAGVASVEVKRFQRWGKLPNQEIENGVLTPAPLEIVQLDNDANFPERGRIEFTMGGGL